MLRTWLSYFLRPNGAGFFLLPPAHLSPLTLRPVWGERWLFARFGPMAATLGDTEVDWAGGRCVTGDERVGAGEGVVWDSREGHRGLGGLWRQWVRKEATKVGLGGFIRTILLMHSPRTSPGGAHFGHCHLHLRAALVPATHSCLSRLARES